MTSPSVDTRLASKVAIADPAIPIFGNGPMPSISNGLKLLSIATLSPINHNGVTESPIPRSPIWISTPSIDSGRPRKITRR